MVVLLHPQGYEEIWSEIKSNSIKPLRISFQAVPVSATQERRLASSNYLSWENHVSGLA